MSARVGETFITSGREIPLEMDRDNTLAAKDVYDEQYVSEWHEDLQSACMTGTFMPDCIEGIS